MNRLARLLLFALVAAPVVGQEIQVPLDSSSSVARIGPKLERKLHLFSAYPGFTEARLFAIADTAFALEIYCRRQSQPLKYRLLLNADQVDSLRRQVTARLQSLAPGVLLNREGRTRFLMRTFLLSYGFYSWAVPVALGLHGRAATSAALLTGSAGFFVPFALSSRLPVTRTRASFSVNLGTTGIAHGMLLSQLMFGNASTFRRNMAVGMAGSLAGLMGGFQLGGKSAPSPGTAELIGLGGDYGLLMGLGSAHLAGVLDKDRPRRYALTALVGSGLGYWGGNSLARAQPYTRGDAELLGTVAVLGAYLAAALVDLTDPKDDRAYTAAAMSGSAVGVGLGNHLLREQAFSRGSARMVMLGSVAGYLLGGAVSQIVGGGVQPWLVFTSVGAVAGFWKTYRAYAGTDTGAVTRGSLDAAPVSASGNQLPESDPKRSPAP